MGDAHRIIAHYGCSYVLGFVDSEYANALFCVYSAFPFDFYCSGASYRFLSFCRFSR